MKKKTTLLMVSAVAVLSATAQEVPAFQAQDFENRISALEKETSKLKKLKISGYIQGQYQWGQQAASLKVGTGNEHAKESFSRIGIRRGRIKFVYEDGIASAVFQLDVTEKGVGFKDAYLNLKDPWIKSMALRAGIFDRPFGYEIGYSSSRRESPERSTICQTLFPDERDLGAMLVLQAPASSPWSVLKLEAGLFAGNGIKQETDSKRDFIGHLSVEKGWKTVTFGAGVSYYNGRVFQGTDSVFTMRGGAFEVNNNPSNKGSFAKREYVGFDARFSVKSPLGLTKLTGEYLFGRQPGLKGSTKSPNASVRPSAHTYIRDFQGGYVMLVQDLGKVPVAVVGKYDWYDPNTKVSGDAVGRGGTCKADLSQSTWGVGALWNLNPAIRLTAFYEFNRNEKTANATHYAGDVKNNVFTLRLQYKF